MTRTAPAPSLRLFNPGLCQSDAEIIDRFVTRQRRGQLDLVLETLRGNFASASCQHVLITGRRGVGKTMLLARLEAELRTDPNLAANLLPVRLPDDSHYEVGTAVDFWLDALSGLACECQGRNPTLAAELAAAHATLCAQWRDPQLRHAVLATIDKGLTAANRRMVAADRVHPDPDQLWKHAVALLDRDAGHYRRCLESLPTGERRVFLALADLWEPSSASTTARRARLDVRIVSVMLGRLAHRGLVGAAGDRPGRRQWSLTDPLISLAYALRRCTPAIFRRRVRILQEAGCARC